MTTNTFKRVGLGLLAALGLTLGARPAAALNQLEASIAALTENGVARHVSTNAIESTAQGWGQTAINLQYVGTSSESVITITKTALTFYVPFNVADTNIGSSGVITLSDTNRDTVGELCDYINGISTYKCRMRDARRSDNTTILGDQTAASGVRNLADSGGYDVDFDTGGVLAADTDYIDQFSLGINPAAGKRVTLKSCDFLSAGASSATFTVSGVLAKDENRGDGVTRDDADVVWQFTYPKDTATSVTFDRTGVGGFNFAAAVQGPAQQVLAPLAVSDPGRVVVRIANSTTNTAQMGPTNYLRCYWLER